MSEIEKAPVLTPENQERVLKYLGLDPRDTATQALVQICNRYGFDPLLKHVVLIGTGGKKNTYVTRDGLLHLAHQSHQLDGIVVEEEGADNEEWWAVVQVHRKDMGHPFKYRGRYSKKGANAKYGPEMAVKCAEVMALRRAFDVSLPTVEEQWDTVSGQVGSVEPLQEHHVPDPKEIEEIPPAEIVKAKHTLSSDPTREELEDHRDRGYIVARMNNAGVSGQVRSDFRSKFGHPDELSGTLMHEARLWVDQATPDVEPF
jgi:hypothetical protein|tara:strand:- start:7343 stop:8119 length:777 start_codon:yes stop_codon:yes gene_type:complete